MSLARPTEEARTAGEAEAAPASSAGQPRIDWTQSEPMRALAALAPGPFAAFAQLEQATFQDGALSARTKELIAVAVTHVTQCEGCLSLHVRNAVRLGASDAEIAEALWVAAELRAGAAVSQARHALRAIETERAAGRC